MSRGLEIGNRTVGLGQPCLITAEIGVNHNGDPETCIKMIDAIAQAGADCVKFQTFTAEEFCSNPNDSYEYISQGETVTESMLEMFRRLEIGYDQFAGFFEHAKKRGLLPLSTPTDRAAVDVLDQIGADAFKVGSDDLVYTPFLEYIAKKGKPVIVSTGMANAADVERAVNAIRGTGNDNIIVLHCVSQYPTEDQDLNLRKIVTIREQFDLEVGFSDHSVGVDAAAAAVALGATSVEKHFTLDRNMPGPDHRFSADPEELADLVRTVRKVEVMMGEGAIEPTEKELEMALISRRSLVAAHNMMPGHVLSEDDVLYQRPGTGLLPYEIKSLVGKKLRESIEAGTLLAFEQFEN